MLWIHWNLTVLLIHVPIACNPLSLLGYSSHREYLVRFNQGSVLWLLFSGQEKGPGTADVYAAADHKALTEGTVGSHHLQLCKTDPLLSPFPVSAFGRNQLPFQGSGSGLNHFIQRLILSFCSHDEPLHPHFLPHRVITLKRFFTMG